VNPFTEHVLLLPERLNALGERLNPSTSRDSRDRRALSSRLEDAESDRGVGERDRRSAFGRSAIE